MPARSAKRQKGRPHKNARSVGPEALVAVARKLLKEKPPTQITGLEIARAAGVDPALIRYYFKDRSTLFVAAAMQALSELRERHRVANVGAKSPSERLRRR